MRADNKAAMREDLYDCSLLNAISFLKCQIKDTRKLFVHSWRQPAQDAGRYARRKHPTDMAMGQSPNFGPFPLFPQVLGDFRLYE
jgi:hypothetical protein